MNVSVRTHSAGYPIYTVQEGENEFELSAFGGQLVDWRRGGTPILFANREHAIVDGKTAYRGGAPICFPYFGKGSFLPSSTPIAPQHGHARTSVWSSEVRESSIVFRTEQPTPERFGPTTLVCELAYVFGDGVRIEATVKNIGENEAPFQLAVHSYWATSRPFGVTISGLGERYLDNFNGFAETFDPAPDAAHTPPFDRVYPDAAERMEFVTEAYRLTVSTEGCTGAVLWNPGADHGIADLGSPDFVCLESGVVTPPVVLLPGVTHRLVINYRAEN